MQKIILISIAALSVMATPAFAGGFALNTQSAEALGAATAGAPATRATPSNAYFNPAAIVGIEGVEGSLSIVGAISDSDFQNASGSLLGVAPVQGLSSGDSVIGDAAFPTGAIAIRLNDRVFVGLAAYAPFGFSSTYSDDSVIRYHGTKSKIVSGSLTPIIGVALTDNWSIAGGLRIQYVDIGLDGVADAAGIAGASMIPGFIPGTDDVPFQLDANDLGLGYMFGVEGALTDNFRIGASYTSKITHDFSGKARFDASASVAGQTLNAVAGLFQDTRFVADFTTPASIQLGAAADLTPSVTLLASASLTRWRSFREIAAVFDNLAQPPEVLTQNWRDAWSGAIGAEVDLSASNTVRFGVMYDESPVNGAFASPRIPDANRIFAAAGYTRKISHSAAFHLAASYVFFDDRAINQSATLPENLFRGSLQSTIGIDSVLVAAGVDIGF